MGHLQPVLSFKVNFPPTFPIGGVFHEIFVYMYDRGTPLLFHIGVLFYFDRYMNGAATNPDCHVLAYAGAQVKKGLDIAKKLGAENFGMMKRSESVSYHGLP